MHTARNDMSGAAAHNHDALRARMHHNLITWQQPRQPQHPRGGGNISDLQVLTLNVCGLNDKKKVRQFPNVVVIISLTFLSFCFNGMLE